MATTCTIRFHFQIALGPMAITLMLVKAAEVDDRIYPPAQLEQWLVVNHDPGNPQFLGIDSRPAEQITTCGGPLRARLGNSQMRDKDMPQPFQGAPLHG